MIKKSFMVRVGADTKDMERGLKSAEARMKKFGEQCTKIGKGMTIAGVAIVAALTMITKKASDAEETYSKFGTVFKDSSAEAEQATEELTKRYGLSTLAAKDMLSATGDLLTGLGMQGKVALSLSRRTQKLSVDLASFTNFQGGAKGASEALTKAMLGERESVKALGIVITEEMVKEELLKKGKEDLTGMALLQAKAEATLAIAVSQSKNAIGDYDRTSGSLANVTRRLVARLESLWVIIGTKLIPVATKYAGKITDIIERTKAWAEAYPIITEKLTHFSAKLGGMLLVLGGTAMAIPKVEAGFKMLKKAAVALIRPAGLAALAILGIAISIREIIKTHKEAVKAMGDMATEALVMGNAAENFKNLWITVRKEGGETLEQFDELMKRFGGNWDMILKTIIADPKFAALKAILMDIAKGVKKISLEGEDLSIELPEQFKEAAVKSLPPFISWATRVAKIFHDTSVRAAEMRAKMKDIKLILPPVAITMPKFTLETELGTEEFETWGEWYKAWVEGLKEKWAEAWRAALDGARDVLGALSGVFSQFHANEAMRIDNEERKKTEAIESWYEQEKAKIEATITDEEDLAEALAALEEKKAEKQGALEEKIEKQRRKLERKRAKAQKVGGLFAAGINVAEAITKALAAGPIIGKILAGVVAALGAIQIAAIASAPLPALQRGGRIEGPALVGEAGPELFVPGRSGMIIPLHREARPMLSTFSPTVNIYAKYLDDRTIDRAAEKIFARLDKEKERYT
ncbi:hypothetical protein ES707_00324 [subsurface metagenome]